MTDKGTMPRFLVLLPLVAMLCIAPWQGSVQARECAAPEPLDVEFSRSAAVFIGRVKSLRVVRVGGGEFDLQTVATFDVENWWKGGRARTVEVRSCGGIDGDRAVICTHGFHFKLGVSYVVFATGRPLETSICLRTNTVEESADVLRWLESIKPK